jgi:beta-glucosidase
MCAYNRINNKYACENEHTLNDMLKGYANFSGFVVSDWGATHSTSDAINAGLDIDMPNPKFFSETLVQAAIDAGNVTTGQIQDTCVRIMAQWYKLPQDKRYPCNGKVCLHANVSTPENKLLARELSSKSTVLLKNDRDLLPLKRPTNVTLSLALIGLGASSAAYTAGTGSGGVQNSPQMVSAFEAFSAIPNVNVVYVNGSDIKSAASAAASADVAIVFGSARSGEGSDRLNLLFHQDFPDTTTEDVIVAVAQVQPDTVVVAVAPGQILTKWSIHVPSILCAFLPGEQFGNAIADVIFGQVVPQAKLPVTFPNKENEQGMTVEQWPGVPSMQFKGHNRVLYSEGQMNGYRWYDKHSVKPAFPFGHGLTYGSSTYSNLQVAGRKVSFDVDVANTGCDTPQVYIGYPGAKDSSVVPTKVLRGFQKLCASETVVVTLSDRDVSEWDVTSKTWNVVSGAFAVYVGSSSQDIRLTGTLTV